MHHLKFKQINNKTCFIFPQLNNTVQATRFQTKAAIKCNSCNGRAVGLEQTLEVEKQIQTNLGLGIRKVNVRQSFFTWFGDQVISWVRTQLSLFNLSRKMQYCDFGALASPNRTTVLYTFLSNRRHTHFLFLSTI